MQPRRKQPSITIRSQRAVERLKLLTRDGRSQAAIVEERLTLKQREARIMEILERIDPDSIPTMAEFDAREYDERGNPR